MKEKLVEGWKNKRIRSGIFFFSYLLFFALVFLLLGTSSKRSVSDPFYLQAILNNNYSFSYTLSINDSHFSYSGDRFSSKSTFLDQDQNQYYMLEDSFYQVMNDKLVLFDKPYLYDEFLDIRSIEKILNHSTYYSKETFSSANDSASASGDTFYHYQVTTTSLYSLLQDREVDYDLEPNSITLKVKDGQTYEILMDVTSYLGSIDSNIEQAKIVLSYDNFLKIKGIDVPYEISSSSVEFIP